MIKQESSERWWYRLIKVIFITMILFSLLIPAIIFLESKPVLDRYESRFSLKCADGRFRGDFDGSDLAYYDLKSFDNSYYNKDKFTNLDRMAKIACHYQETGDELKPIVESESTFVPTEKNYEIFLRKPSYSNSWVETISYTVLAFLGVILFFSLLRAIFLYIIFGENFGKNLVFIFCLFKSKRKIIVEKQK